jgi:uncharacterized protein CbrC (UPF0167 family)
MIIPEIDCVGCKNEKTEICKKCMADGSSSDYFEPTISYRLKVWWIGLRCGFR